MEKQFSYLLTINEMDTNTKMRVWYNRKGAELWEWLARAGYVALIPYDGYGYYYDFEKLKSGLERMGKEGMLQAGGYFHDAAYR